MQITTKATGLVITPAIEAYIAEKFAVLSKFINSKDTSAEGQVEVGKTTRHHKSGNVFRAEISLHIAGKDFWTEQTADELYIAIDKVRDEIVRMLHAHKAKQTEQKRTGGRTAKKMMRWLGK